MLEKVCLVVAKGEKVIFTGTNGSGKTTLLQVLAGLITLPTNENVGDTGELALYLPANANFLFYDSVEDGLLEIVNQDKELLDETIGKYGLGRLIAPLTRSSYSALSKGQRKLVNIVLILVQATMLDISYILIDELEAYLDDYVTQIVMTSLMSSPLTIVCSSHVNPQYFSGEASVYQISAGRIEALSAHLSKNLSNRIVI